MATRRTKDAEVRVVTTTASDPASAPDPGSGDVIEHVTNIDHNKQRSDIEHDEVGDDSKRRTKGLADFQITVDVNFDDAATVQQRIRDAEKDRDDLNVHYLYDGTNGWENICNVTVTTGASGAPDELLTETYELKGATGFVWNAV